MKDSKIIIIGDAGRGKTTFAELFNSLFDSGIRTRLLSKFCDELAPNKFNSWEILEDCEALATGAAGGGGGGGIIGAVTTST